MAAFTGKIIIAKNIKLDRDYKNILSYSESQMLSLVNSNKVAEATNASFVRVGGNSVDVPFTFAQCINSNYLAFQNPLYSDKWFFCFIDQVEYRNDSTTRITFTVDVCSTWRSYWTAKTCFTIREHVNSDTVGSNTVPENLEVGEYVCNGITKLYSGGSSVYVAVATSYVPDELAINTLVRRYGGIYSGTSILLFDSPYNSVSNFLRGMDALDKGDAIVSVFMVPQDLAGDVTFETKSFTVDETTYTTHVAVPTYTDGETVLKASTSVAIPTSLNGYTPKNNKLFTYPYNYFYVSNNAGSDVEYHYEDFVSNSATFETIGVLSVGCSLKTVPLNYKKVSDGTGTFYSFNYGITGAKYPVCSWSCDAFTNWLTENSVNLGISTAGSVGAIVGGAAMIATGAGAVAGAGMIAGGIGGIASEMAQVYQHSLTPPQAKGNTNSGDIAFAAGAFGVPAFKMSIRAEYAKIIDEYFTRFGYKINRLKVPNQTGRTYWNFVQIGTGENIGYSSNASISVPTNDMEQINQVYRNGVTIWHNHDNLGDYSLNNTIA